MSKSNLTLTLLRLLIVLQFVVSPVLSTPAVAKSRGPERLALDEPGSTLELGQVPEGAAPDSSSRDRIYSLYLPAVIHNAPSGRFSLTVNSSPDVVLVGDVVTGTVRLVNSGEWPTGPGRLTVRAPAELGGLTQFVSLPPLTPGQEISHSLTLTVDLGTPLTPITWEAEARAEGVRSAAVASSTLWIGQVTSGLLGPDGGRLQSQGGRVAVEAPAGALTETVTARMVLYRATPPDDENGLMLRFALEPDLGFQSLVTLTLDVDGLVDLQDLPPLAHPFVATQAAGLWVEWPDVEVDEPNNRLVARVDHFSDWGGGVDLEKLEAGWRPLFYDPAVALFTGAASYSFPIEVPPGQGGLAPELALSYNSSQIDGILQWLQSDWVGFGWSLDSPQIVRGGIHRTWEGNWTGYSADFTLLLNGASYRLVPAQPGADWGRYHTRDESFLYVERVNDCSDDGDCEDGTGGSPENATGEYWIVRTQNGRTYRFGYREDAEQTLTHPIALDGEPVAGYVGRDVGLVGYRWRVDTVTDALGNHVEFLYDQVSAHEQYLETGGPNGGWGAPGHQRGNCARFPFVNNTDWDRASYLQEIRYNWSEAENDWLTRILFHRTLRGGDDDDVDDASQGNDCDQIFFTRKVLRRITVEQHGHVVAEYGLDYAQLNDPPGGRASYIPARVLDQVTTYGQGGWQDGDGPHLPPTAFAYDWFHNKGKCHYEVGWDCGDWEPEILWNAETFPYPRLTRVANGYGAEVTLDYERDRDAYWVASHWRVTTKETGDGLGQVAGWQYEYGPPVYKHNGALIGHQWTDVTTLDYDGQPLSHSKHWFHTDEVKRGREYRSEVWDQADGTCLLKSETGYGQPLSGTLPSGVHFVVVTGTHTHQYEDGGAAHTCTAYEYDEYGNVIAEYDYGDAGLSGDERTVRRSYVHNVDPAVWLIGLPASEALYPGLVTDPEQAEPETVSFTYYDSHLPTLPLPRRVEAGWEDSPYVTQYAYDRWGNQRVVTDALGRAAETTYDDLYHLFPVQVENALGQRTNNLYYGVNYDLGLNGDGAFFGGVYHTYGPNGPSTGVRYRYDAFGRTLQERRPDDGGNGWVLSSESEYVEDYQAPNGQRLVRVGLSQREEYDGGGQSRAFVFLDGLGRTVQARSEAAGGQVVVGAVDYDGLGRAVATYSPYFGSGDLGAYVPVPEGTAATVTQYDPLDRVVRVVGPDNGETRKLYHLPGSWVDQIGRGFRQEEVVDANGHKTIHTFDAADRLVWVGQQDVGGWCDALHVTLYDYDVRDNLVQVTRGGHVCGSAYTPGAITTRITYDELGRKIAMDDPDMGVWGYEYDWVGNLLTQTNALGERVGFEYDDLNRLVRKSANGQTIASYTYDEGGYGIGQRTGMTYLGGSATYQYDERGRLAQETRSFEGVEAGPFVVAYAYDAMDRIESITYPDGEVVQQGYDDGGNPLSLIGGEDYVTSAQYNAAGQLKRVAFGNGLETRYGYFGYEYYGQGDGLDLNADGAWGPVSYGLLLQTCTVAQGDSCPLNAPSGALLNLSYWYDDVGNILAARNRSNQNQVQFFQYDALDRLTRAYTEEQGGGGQGEYDRSYRYDGLGNLIKRREGNANWVDYTYLPDRPHAVTGLSDGSFDASYDLNGNMVSRAQNGTTYEQAFDVENHLVAVTDTQSGEVTRFVYDGDGVRAMQIDAEGTTLYVGEIYELFFPNFQVPLQTLTSGGPAELLESVDPDWWAQAQAGIRSEEYHITRVAGVYQAPNRAHNLRLVFHPDHVQIAPRIGDQAWRWTWRLTGLGREGAVSAPITATQVVSGNRVAYHRPGLIEWYVNDRNGLEQGFTLQERPDGDGPLALQGMVGGNLTMRQDGDVLSFVDARGNVLLEYGALHVFDAESRPVPAWLEANGSHLRIWIDDAGYTYPLTIDPLVTSPSWVAEGDQTGAHFGWSVSTAGDVNGDGYADVIVGAPNYDAGSYNLGRVYVYYGSATGLSLTPDWMVQGSQSDDFFGYSVASAGDVNGDGYEDVIFYGSDLVWVHQGSETGLNPSPDWTASGSHPYDGFGSPLGGAGDVNGDGYDDVIVGEYLYSGGLNDQGRALVYHGSENGLSQNPDWTAEGGLANAWFGYSVATAGDVNGDGYGDVIVGAPQHKSGGLAVGRAYVYHGSANGLEDAYAWMVEGDQDYAWFAYSVDTAGDVNGDGYADVIVGAHMYDGGQDNEGQVCVYHGSDAGLAPTPAWTAESDQVGAQMGLSLGPAGDVNGDGYADVVVGIPLYDDGELDEGAAYVYLGASSGLGLAPAWTAEGDQGAVRFGLSVGTAGDVNGDGYDDLIVGAGYYDVTDTVVLTDAGRAYVYLSDKAPPALSVTHPVDGLQLGHPRLFVRGSAQDNVSGVELLALRIFPAGRLYTPGLGAGGQFTQSLGSADLSPGPNTLIVTATDGLGNAAVVSRTLFLDTHGPTISDLTPQGPVAQSQPVVAATFSVTGTAAISPASTLVWLDGQDVTAAAAVGADGFSYTPGAPLTDGPHAVYVQVQDLAGNRAQADWSFEVDSFTWVQFDQPLPGSLLNTLTTTVSGQTEVGATVDLSVNQVKVGQALAGDGRFQFEAVPLQLGENRLALSAVDPLGNEASAQLTVTVDPDRPWADVSAQPPVFAPGGCVDRTTFELAATPPAGQAIAAWQLRLLDGAGPVASFQGSGHPPLSQEWDGGGLPEGDYTYRLVVTATNGASVTTPPQIVRLDLTPPAAPTILAPAQPVTTTHWRAWLAGQAEPGSTVTLLDGGYFTTTLTETVGLDGRWAGYYPLHGGVNQIWAIAVDATCEASPPSAPVQVTLLAQPPLYTVGVSPTTVAAGDPVTLWGTARWHRPYEGAPTQAVWSWPPSGEQVSLGLQSVFPGGEVSLWSEGWSLPVWGSSGDYPVFFEAVDQDNLSGYGEAALSVRNRLASPQITWPAGPYYTTDPQLNLQGTVAEGYLTVRAYDAGLEKGSLALGPALQWSLPVTLIDDGPHPLYARAEDRFGQVSGRSGTITVTLDTVPPASQVTPLPDWQAQASFRVDWSGADAGSGVAAYDVQVRDGDGPWQNWRLNTQHTSALFAGQEGHVYGFRCRARDRAGNQEAWPVEPDAQTGVDITLPQAAVAAALDGTTVQLTWEAQDDGSGLATCELAAREDGGDWQFLSAVCAGVTAYPTEPGHVYDFRLNATDRAGNLGSDQVRTGPPAPTRYYYFDGRRVAMRGPDDGVLWLHGDHLGSTSLVTDEGGEEVARQWYYPFGQARGPGAGLPTDYHFTGQRNMSTIGLYDYRARFYDPYVGRFISPDTIVPNPGDGQNFNRYSYVRNNPLKYVDPSGHMEINEGDWAPSPLVDLWLLRIQDNTTCPACSTAMIDWADWIYTHPGYDPANDPFLAMVQAHIENNHGESWWGIGTADVGDVGKYYGVDKIAKGEWEKVIHSTLIEFVMPLIGAAGQTKINFELQVAGLSPEQFGCASGESVDDLPTTQRRYFLEDHMDKEEFRLFVRDTLDVDYDNLRGEGLFSKMNEFVMHANRRGDYGNSLLAERGYHYFQRYHNPVVANQWRALFGE